MWRYRKCYITYIDDYDNDENDDDDNDDGVGFIVDDNEELKDDHDDDKWRKNIDNDDEDTVGYDDDNNDINENMLSTTQTQLTIMSICKAHIFFSDVWLGNQLRERPGRVSTAFSDPYREGLTDGLASLKWYVVEFAE